MWHIGSQFHWCKLSNPLSCTYDKLAYGEFRNVCMLIWCLLREFGNQANWTVIHTTYVHCASQCSVKPASFILVTCHRRSQLTLVYWTKITTICTLPSIGTSIWLGTVQSGAPLLNYPLYSWLYYNTVVTALLTHGSYHNLALNQICTILRPCGVSLSFAMSSVACRCFSSILPWH